LIYRQIIKFFIKNFFIFLEKKQEVATKVALEDVFCKTEDLEKDVETLFKDFGKK